MKFIPMAKPDLRGNELRYVSECIRSGWIGFTESKESDQGISQPSIDFSEKSVPVSFVSEFEKKFSSYCGAKKGISTSNGTCSLALIYEALGIGKGDEVIVPDLTFAATASEVIHCGATPVFADCDANTWNMEAEQISKKITPKTKAICVVHLYGVACDIAPIKEIVEKKGIALIEDAAQSHGTEYKGKRTGGLADYSSFSFYGNKLITTGEGGMVLTNDLEFYEKAKIIRNQGQDPNKTYWHTVLGNNYRMGNVQAAIGLAQLEKIEEFLKIKRRNAKTYSEALSGIEGISLTPEPGYSKNNWWMYSILLERSFHKSKEKLIEQFRENKIDYRPLFYPLHDMPPYKSAETFSVSSEISRKGITLPSNLFLTEADVERVAETIKSK